MRFFAVVLSFATLTFACSSSPTQGTGAQAASSSDGGTTTTKKPIKVGNATKDAGKDSDVMPDPTPGLVPTCKGAALCVGDCADNDEACFAACMKGMPDDEFAKFEAVGTCINNSGCETDECVQESCATEIQACIGE